MRKEEAAKIIDAIKDSVAKDPNQFHLTVSVNVTGFSSAAYGGGTGTYVSALGGGPGSRVTGIEVGMGSTSIGSDVIEGQAGEGRRELINACSTLGWLRTP